MGAESLGDVFSRVADQIIADLLRIAIQQAIIKPLAGALFGGEGGGGGALGSLFAGFFAKGGLIPAGTFGIVGENGPEPVIGTSRGAAVLPNSALGKMQSAAGQVEVLVGIDSDSAGNIMPVITKVARREIAQAAPAIRAAAIGDVGEQMGGLLDNYGRRNG
jgi:hypothetical protein